MRYDQYVLDSDLDVFLKCRRCGMEEQVDGTNFDHAVHWAEEHELVCEGEDRP